MTSRSVYLNHPGLARITVAAADEQTALAVAHRLIAGHNPHRHLRALPGAR
ncbi:DUF6207 family protein [Streptomyces rectiviolaceus]|uniref:DUF6207 family protein n=1 Tax=Streptomyces rectiviolaceus TaxID=332591 RepID=UPI003637B3CC